MKNLRTSKLHSLGVSIWLDNITRRMLDDGTIGRYIHELSVTGLTSNPTIFDNAIANSTDYDDAIHALQKSGISDEDLFFELAVGDIQRAADLFLPVYQRTNGLDGFVSIEISPLLAYDTENTIKAAKDVFAKVNRSNTFIKIPGTPEGLPAIEQVIAEGIPVNITLLFSHSQYKAAAEAFLKGIEARIKKGLNPDVRSVASVFVSRWDKAVSGNVPPHLQNQLGIAVMRQVYREYQEFLLSERVGRIMNFGVLPQRLLWASTGTKDPNASDVLYVKSLVAPFTINTIPDNTLLAYADHGEPGSLADITPEQSMDLLKQFQEAGFEYEILGERLQKEGSEAFVKSWEHLIRSIRIKRT